MSPYGMLAEFEDAPSLLRAIARTKGAGFTEIEAYTPFPVEEVTDALGYRDRLPLLIFAGGVFGGVLGFGLQWYLMGFDFPINVGGRPYLSWPAFIIVTFELTILFAALSAVLGMLALNRLPRPHHPLFALEAFESASRDRFFLMILARDPKWDPGAARTSLQLDSLSLNEVPQ